MTVKLKIHWLIFSTKSLGMPSLASLPCFCHSRMCVSFCSCHSCFPQVSLTLPPSLLFIVPALPKIGSVNTGIYLAFQINFRSGKGFSYVTGTFHKWLPHSHECFPGSHTFLSVVTLRIACIHLGARLYLLLQKEICGMAILRLWTFENIQQHSTF